MLSAVGFFLSEIYGSSSELYTYSTMGECRSSVAFLSSSGAIFAGLPYSLSNDGAAIDPVSPWDVPSFCGPSLYANSSEDVIPRSFKSTSLLVSQ